MRIDCLHGYFFFREDRPGEASEFMSYYGLTLVGKQDYFTLEQLEQAPDYSIKGAPILGAQAIETFAGAPWDVFKANKLVFDLITGTLKPIAQIVNRIRLDQSGFYFSSDGLINPGSFDQNDRKITGYRATLSTSLWVFRYSEVSFV